MKPSAISPTIQNSSPYTHGHYTIKSQPYRNTHGYPSTLLIPTYLPSWHENFLVLVAGLQREREKIQGPARRNIPTTHTRSTAPPDVAPAAVHIHVQEYRHTYIYIYIYIYSLPPRHTHNCAAARERESTARCIFRSPGNPRAHSTPSVRRARASAEGCSSDCA